MTGGCRFLKSIVAVVVVAGCAVCGDACEMAGAGHPPYAHVVRD